MNQCVVFVHPIMSVDINFKFCKDNGYKIFTIITDFEASKIDSAYLSKISDFVYKSSGSVEINLSNIKDIIKNNNLEIIAIINGIDASLYYTDYLYNNLIGTIKLDLEFSKARLNKYKVNEILAKNNIRIIKSVEINCYADLISKKQQILDLNWPIVAKPAEDTAAMAGFQIINSLQELDNYVKHSLNSKNAYYGATIKSIILQTYLPIGQYDEFIIDFCCYGDKKILNGIGSYDKERIRKDTYVYRGIKGHLPSEIEGISPVIEYVRSILDALKVRYGYTHNEVFWDRKDNFYLIESNNRIVGSGVNEVYTYIYGKPTLSYIFDLTTAHNNVLSSIDKRFGFAQTLYLYNFYSPKFKTLNLATLTSNAEINSMYCENMTNRNFDNYTRADCVGASVILSNTDKESLELDIKEILKREASGDLFIS